MQSTRRCVDDLINPVVGTLRMSLTGRKDVFFTTSFGYQSELLFFLLNEAGIRAECIYIKSPLSGGGIDAQADHIITKYNNFSVVEVDRTDWTTTILSGRNFMDLDIGTREVICRALKRGPIIDYIETNGMSTWISGIRRDQTEKRSNLAFFETTDLGVIKLSPMFLWGKYEVEFLVKKLKLRVNQDYFDMCKWNESNECGLHG